MTIKNHTLSGDRISTLATIHGRPRDFSERELVFLDLERNISVGTRRVYSFKLKTAPLKLYTVSIEVPKVFYPLYCTTLLRERSTAYSTKPSSAESTSLSRHTMTTSQACYYVLKLPP